jgi:hypothetical protein
MSATDAGHRLRVNVKRRDRLVSMVAGFLYAIRRNGVAALRVFKPSRR